MSAEPDLRVCLLVQRVVVLQASHVGGLCIPLRLGLCPQLVLRLHPRLGPFSAPYTVRPLTGVAVRVDLDALGVAGCRRARILSPDTAPTEVAVHDGRMVVSKVGLWTLVVLERP